MNLSSVVGCLLFLISIFSKTLFILPSTIIIIIITTPTATTCHH